MMINTRRNGMDQIVKLKHPQGKNAISMSKNKYDLLKPVVLKFLRTQTKATFTELSAGIANELKRKETKFRGSLLWYLEWVKLDLEARKIIKRVPNTTPQEYMIVG
jgi:hypothetical protein